MTSNIERMLAADHAHTEDEWHAAIRADQPPQKRSVARVLGYAIGGVGLLLAVGWIVAEVWG